MTAGNYDNCAANGFPRIGRPFEEIRRQSPEEIQKLM